MGRPKCPRRTALSAQGWGCTQCPKKRLPEHTLLLLKDELEALYLADFQGLYHEDCAQKMAVSRTTFARILKEGRKKTVQALMFGQQLIIQQNQENQGELL